MKKQNKTKNETKDKIINKWWTFCFTMEWDSEKENHKSWIDLFIINEIIKPITKQFPMIFRIHRRANNWNKKEEYISVLKTNLSEPVYVTEYVKREYYTKDVGHQLKLYAYCTEEFAKEIDSAIKHVMSIIDNKRKVLKFVDYQWKEKAFTKENKNTGIKDNSDENWSLLIQYNWFTFIQGMSLSLIKMIEDAYENIDDSYKSNSETAYKKVETIINNIWYTQGCHAFLHHINALFDSQPFILKEQGKQPVETRL